MLYSEIVDVFTWRKTSKLDHVHSGETSRQGSIKVRTTYPPFIQYVLEWALIYMPNGGFYGLSREDLIYVGYYVVSDAEIIVDRIFMRLIVFDEWQQHDGGSMFCQMRTVAMLMWLEDVYIHFDNYVFMYAVWHLMDEIYIYMLIYL